MKRQSSVRSLAALCLTAVSVPRAPAQATYTAVRNSRLQVGVGALYLRNDYTTQPDLGFTAWVDYDVRRWIGIELEGHLGGIQTPDDIGENSYLVGPRLNYRRGPLNLYGKGMVGRGTIFNQLYETSSSFNLYAGGAGLEYRLGRRLNLRAADVEWQRWPSFPYQPISPLAVSAGVLYILR